MLTQNDIKAIAKEVANELKKFDRTKYYMTTEEAMELLHIKDRRTFKSQMRTLNIQPRRGGQNTDLWPYHKLIAA